MTATKNYSVQMKILASVKAATIGACLVDVEMCVNVSPLEWDDGCLHVRHYA